MDQEKLIGLLEALKEKAENPELKDEIKKVIDEVKSTHEKQGVKLLNQKNKKLAHRVVDVMAKIFLHAGSAALGEGLFEIAKEALKHLRQLLE